MTTPLLWAVITAGVSSKRPQVTVHRVQTWLGRSGAIPIYLKLVVNERLSEDVSLLISIRDHIRHWGGMTLITGSHEIARQVMVFLMGSSSERLDHFSCLFLMAGSPLSDNFQEEQEPNEGNSNAHADITDVFRVLAQANAGHLRELILGAAALPYRVWQPAIMDSPFSVYPTKSMLSSVTLSLPSLQTLRLFERSSNVAEIGASSILHLLAKCPSLRTFIFRGSNLFDPHGVHGMFPIDLPHLRTLHLCQTFHQRIILSHLHTPKLNTLRLMWLNRPERLVDESYEPDSEERMEEEAEFSQSPWTDLLTGSGIRSLIRHTRLMYGLAPPITVLDMDFADIRSPKDFVWVFEHLPLLEEFRIVGSDMSDKVLLALASQRKIDSGREEWLCPCLRRLEFSRCDIITGLGIISLAKARNPPIESDIAHMEGQPARLEKFMVDGCGRIDCESVAVLQYIMGDVCFDVEPMEW